MDRVWVGRSCVRSFCCMTLTFHIRTDFGKYDVVFLVDCIYTEIFSWYVPFWTGILVFYKVETL